MSLFTKFLVSIICLSLVIIIIQIVMITNYKHELLNIKKQNVINQLELEKDILKKNLLVKDISNTVNKQFIKSDLSNFVVDVREFDNNEKKFINNILNDYYFKLSNN